MHEATPLTATLYWRDDPIFTGTPEEAALSMPQGADLEPGALDRVGAVDLGSQVRLHIERAERVDAVEARGAPDWGFRRAAALSWLVHAFLVAAALLTPPGLGLPLDGLQKRATILKPLQFRPPEPATPAPAVSAPGLQRREDSRVGAPRVERGPSAPVDMKQVGLLKHLGPDGALGRVLGGGPIGAGWNEALEALRGPSFAAGDGAGGLDSRGAGPGGDGGSVGIGRLRGRPREGDFGDVALGGRGKPRVRVVPGRTVLGEGLGKAEVGRVMRRHLNRFRHCYEKQLGPNPNLAGKVTVRFTIAPNGRVAQTAIAESTISDPAVERCVRGVVKTLVFPRPRGGGVVMVSYPFLFSSVD